MLLEISGLSKYYDGVQALSDITFSVKPGEIVGLVGTNGAGKSTLLKCLTGTLMPDHGSILFNGETLIPGNPMAARKAGIAMIYQHLDLCRQSDVITNIFLGQEMTHHLCGIKTSFLNRTAMRIQTQTLLNGINASVPFDRPVQQLSGGQQQAVAIARAMLSLPKLLIMDEPTSALSVKESENVLNLIRSLKQQGVSIILTSHRLSDVFAVADRVVLLQQGCVVSDTPVQDTSLDTITNAMFS